MACLLCLEAGDHFCTEVWIFLSGGTSIEECAVSGALCGRLKSEVINGE